MHRRYNMSDPADQPSQLGRIVSSAGVSYLAWWGYRKLIAANPDWSKTLYSWSRTLEERSPYSMFKTFGWGDHYSTAVLPDRFHLPGKELINGGIHSEISRH